MFNNIQGEIGRVMYYGTSITNQFQLKKNLKRYHVCDSMKHGYEAMGKLNLALSEEGTMDYTSLLHLAENKLNGDEI